MVKFASTGSVSTLAITVDGYNECVNSDPNIGDGRSILALDVTASNENSLDIIVKCKSGYLPIMYTLNMDYSSANYEADPGKYGDDLMFKQPAISICFAPTTNSQ